MKRREQDSFAAEQQNTEEFAAKADVLSAENPEKEDSSVIFMHNKNGVQDHKNRRFAFLNRRRSAESEPEDVSEDEYYEEEFEENSEDEEEIQSRPSFLEFIRKRKSRKENGEDDSENREETEEEYEDNQSFREETEALDYDDDDEDIDDEEAISSPQKYYNKPLLWIWLLFFGGIIWLEAVLKVWVYGFGALFSLQSITVALFSAAIAALFTLLMALFKGIPGRLAGGLLLGLTTVWMMIQTVYYKVFSVFFTVYSLTGADDVAEFWRSTLGGILGSLIPILLMAIPFVLYFVFRRHLILRNRPTILGYALVVILLTAFQVGAIAMVFHQNDDAMSGKYLYTKTFIPKLSVKNFGALTTFRLDVKNMIFGIDDEAVDLSFEEESEKNAEESIVYGDNVMEIDFSALAAGETNGTLKDMDTYFASVTPTAKNAKTGSFAGKNLIWIVAEGFSSWALNDQLTPTLSKMAKECYVFQNFYNPIWGVSTSDGEYTTCTGLIPKSGVWSMSKSAANDMRFCMGNQLSKLGYLCNAYHDHSYTYYNRDASHPNMGYNYIGKGNGLQMTTQWPESDVEMMEKTVGDYANAGQPFHIYYMTVSGHLEYNFGGNAMAAKHKAEVADLPYSDACKAYTACQMEFDQAVAYLINTLSNAGVLDDTLIVISGDHYPYGLTLNQITELNGMDVEGTFEKYHSTLIMWNSAMAAAGITETVTEPCCAIDILPTISNLMGVTYDSRLLMGRDIFSGASPLVVFSDHSWISDKGRYSALSGEFYPVEGVTVEDDYIQNMMNKVNAMFSYSAKILETDYYAKVVPDTAPAATPAVTPAPTDNTSVPSEAVSP